MCDYPCHHVISEQLGAQRSQALSLFHTYTGCDLPSSIFSIVKKWLKCVLCFSCCKYLLSPWPKTQPAVSPIPTIWHGCVFGLNTTNTACFVPTCKRALMVAAFTKLLSFLVPLYEAVNGMAGPGHGYHSGLSYLTQAGLLFAVALWMYSCVQGELHVGPCWGLTKHILQMWTCLHKQWYRQMTFTKTSELSRC